MVEARKVQYEKLKGDYLGEVMAIEVSPNQYFQPEEPNSTRDVLTVKLRLRKPDTMAWVEREQRFVAPLVGGKGLFAQMCDVKGLDVGEDDTVQIDEQSLVGLIAVFTVGERTTKDNRVFEEVKGCRSRDEVAPTAQVEAKTPEDFLPFD